MEQKKNPEGQPNPVVEVQKFITRTWEHPLLNDQTKLARSIGRKYMEENMEAGGYGLNDYIAIPCGSILWSVDTASDYDFLVIDLTQEGTPETEDEVEMPPLPVEISPLHSEIHILRVRNKQFVEHSPSGPVTYHLLFTPDDYLVGNKEAAALLRLQMIDEIPTRETNWQAHSSDASYYFDRYFRFWNNATNGYSEGFLGGGTDKRRLRFSQRLEERSQQAENPSYWKSQFLRARSRLQLPSFTQYKDALTITNGALSLNPRFVADGIKNNE